MINLTKKERKELRTTEALDRASAREIFLNKEGRAGYIKLLERLNVKFPTGAKKEKAKYTKIIKSIKA